MANDHVKLNIMNEIHEIFDRNFDDEVEMIFGKPPAQAATKNHVTNNVHLMDAERGLDTHFNGIHNNLGESDLEPPTQPLLEPSREQQVPPLTEPEIDDLDGDPPKDATSYPGIDDGLLETTGNKPLPHEDHESVPTIVVSGSPVGSEHQLELEPSDKPSHARQHDDGATTYDILPWVPPVGNEALYPHVGSEPHSELEPSDKTSHGQHDDGATTDDILLYQQEAFHPYDVNRLTKRFGVSLPVSPMPGVIPDVNIYQQKKNLAQGMMDLALLSANANQLRYVLESASTHPYYYSSVVFISLSIVFQILVGVGLIMNSQYDVNDNKERCKADKINNMTVLGIFLITIVNVFITSFSVATQTVPQQAG